jgi:hypothetical protein
MAKEVFSKYQDSLQSGHKRVSHSKMSDYQLFFVKGKNVEAVFHYGSFVGGVLNSTGVSKAQRIIEEIVQKLRDGCS